MRKATLIIAVVAAYIIFSTIPVSAEGGKKDLNVYSGQLILLENETIPIEPNTTHFLSRKIIGSSFQPFVIPEGKVFILTDITVVVRNNSPDPTAFLLGALYATTSNGGDIEIHKFNLFDKTNHHRSFTAGIIIPDGFSLKINNADVSNHAIDTVRVLGYLTNNP